jgi:predicted O-methyltransferase YrrM
MPIGRRTRNRIKALAGSAFRVGQRLGVDVLPRHFYSAVPDIRELQRTTHWRAPTSMVGVQGTDTESQLAFVASCCTPDIVERLRHNDVHSRAIAENGDMGYGPTEADFLYAVIRARRPARVVQVGAGVSTAIILLAARDGGFPLDLVCVDPYPTDYLRRAHGQGRLRLIAEKAQEVELSQLTDVGENGMLFVDSTHTVKVGSEVNRIVLEVLPRLARGTLVHFHDICFPYDYSPDVLRSTLFWTETTLLHAFLAGNRRYTLRVSLSMLHRAVPDRLKQYLPNYTPAPLRDGLEVPGATGHFPSAAYLEVIGD